MGPRPRPLPAPLASRASAANAFFLPVPSPPPFAPRARAARGRGGDRSLARPVSRSTALAARASRHSISPRNSKPGVGLSTVFYIPFSFAGIGRDFGSSRHPMNSCVFSCILRKEDSVSHDRTLSRLFCWSHFPFFDPTASPKSAVVRDDDLETFIRPRVSLSARTSKRPLPASKWKHIAREGSGK